MGPVAMLEALYLMRHAKSDWPDHVSRDFDRPLATRGEQDAHKVGLWLSENRVSPQVVLSSPALRAQQTTNIVCEHTGLEDVVQWVDAIYEASTQTLQTVLGRYRDTHKQILMVGHNPGFADLITELVTVIPERFDIHKLMPAGALAHIAFGNGKTQLQDIIKPSEL